MTDKEIQDEILEDCIHIESLMNLVEDRYKCVEYYEFAIRHLMLCKANIDPSNDMFQPED